MKSLFVFLRIFLLAIFLYALYTYVYKSFSLSHLIIVLLVGSFFVFLSHKIENNRKNK